MSFLRERKRVKGRERKGEREREREREREKDREKEKGRETEREKCPSVPQRARASLLRPPRPPAGHGRALLPADAIALDGVEERRERRRGRRKHSLKKKSPFSSLVSSQLFTALAPKR